MSLVQKSTGLALACHSVLAAASLEIAGVAFGMGGNLSHVCLSGHMKTFMLEGEVDSVSTRIAVTTRSYHHQTLPGGHVGMLTAC